MKGKNYARAFGASILLGGALAFAPLLDGCSGKSETPESQQTRQSQPQNQSQLETKINLPEPTPALPKAPEKEDYSTPITKVSLYTPDTLEGVPIRTNYLEKINPAKLEGYGMCKVCPESNNVALVLFKKEGFEVYPWGGAVYASYRCSSFTHSPALRTNLNFRCTGILGDAKFLGLRVHSYEMKRIRIEAQDNEEELGTTYRDEIRLHTNAVNDILVDLSKLATNSSGSRLKNICQLKLIAEWRYLNAEWGALTIYDMGLK